MHTYIISNDEDDYVVTQHDIDNNFVFLTPKQNHQETLVPINSLGDNQWRETATTITLLSIGLRLDQLSI